MKKLLAIITLLALLFALPAGAAGYKTLLQKDGFYYFDADGNDVWLADTDGLWLSKGGTDPKLILEQRGITALDSLGSSAYIAYADSGDSIAAEVAPDGTITREWLLGEERVNALCALEDTLALLVGETAESSLLLVDRASGAMKPVDDAVDLHTICAGQDGKSVLVMSIFTDMIWRVDAATAAAEELGVPGVFANAMQETPSGAIRILLIQPDYVKIYEYTPGGEAAEKGEIATGSSPGYGVALSGEHIFVQLASGLRRYNIADFKPAEPKRTLNICLDIGAMGDMRFTQAIRLFQQKYPDVQVKQEVVNREDLVLSLMSGEQACDIFFMDPQSTDPLERAGLFADMSAYPQITQELENWLEMDGLLYDSQGRLIRVPTSIRASHCWAVPYVHHYDLLVESGLEIPTEPMDYARFRSLCEQAREKGIYLYATETRLSEVEALYTALYADPMNGVLDYDTPEFREMMEFWKSLKDDDLVLFFNSLENGYENLKNNQTHLYSIDLGERGISYHRDPAVRKWIYPPTPDGTPIAPVRVEALYLYAYGAQMDLAADFIATYASVEAQAAEYDCVNLVLKDLTLYNNYETWTTPYQISYPVRWPEIGTVEEMDVYPEEREHSAELYASAVPVRFMDEVRLPFHRLTEQYMNGEISLDELIAALNEKADIWLNE